MTILGVLAIFAGGALFAAGNAVNNDLDMQMESIFNDGVSNPGSPAVTLSILLLVAGFAFLIIGAITSNKKKREMATVATKIPAPGNDMKRLDDETLICQNCGAKAEPGSKFCMNCGKPLKEKTLSDLVFCPYCGGKLSSENKFCAHCGKEQETFSKQ